ncbi:MAG: hypothetical protein MUF71_08925 [Candidatus Kapabacteria bacterium]|jgi:hypothetical protein|nr:hypothetical protein [Candidatus Kapabacteria bacterium]
MKDKKKKIRKVRVSRFPARLSLLLALLFAVCTTLSAQPTPREFRYICAWNGVPVREHADMKSKQVGFKNYGDLVIFKAHNQRGKDTVSISICKSQSMTNATTETVFPAWNETAHWIYVEGTGYIPTLYLSKDPPLLVDTTTHRVLESIQQYLERTRSRLELKFDQPKFNDMDIERYKRRGVYPLRHFARAVYGGGVVFEFPFDTLYEQDNYLLIHPDWSLAEAYHFLNAISHLEPSQQQGFDNSFDDTIRLITKEENRLVFSNNYVGGGKKGKPRKQFTIQRINETIIITKEEVFVD